MMTAAGASEPSTEARFASVEARVTLAEARAIAAEARATAADQRVSGHESLCALRYQGIIDRVRQVEHILLGGTAAVILGLASVVGTLFWRLPAVH